MKLIDRICANIQDRIVGSCDSFNSNYVQWALYELGYIKRENVDSDNPVWSGKLEDLTDKVEDHFNEFISGNSFLCVSCCWWCCTSEATSREDIHEEVCIDCEDGY